MRTWIAGLAVLLVTGTAGLLLAAHRPAIEPIARPTPDAFPADAVRRGRDLAAIGNCASCHTAPGGAPYAGGVPITSSFGTIYASNVTPHEETGIGRWSGAAFARSMRQGVARNGDHHYPAYPYTHYTLLADEDVADLYAYLMTREPVENTPPPNELPLPLRFRPLLAGWKLLNFEEGRHVPDEALSGELDRGAYLADGLAHCGACHTPRGPLGGEIEDRYWAGGMAGGWNAYAINTDSPAPIPWDEEAMAFYLRHGWHEAHGVSRGTMMPVTRNLGRVPAEDVASIAAYTVHVMGERPAAHDLRARVPTERGRAATADSQVPPWDDEEGVGAAVYAGACASCHESDRPQPYGGLPFALSTAVHADSPQNIVNVTFWGLPPRDGEASAVMPGYEPVLSDGEMVALLEHLRTTFTDLPPWEGLADMVADTRSGAHAVTLYPADSYEEAPGAPRTRDGR